MHLTYPVALFAILCASFSPAALANTPNEIAALLKKNNCMVCHHMQGRTVVGPTYQAIAERYAGQADDMLPVLVERVRRGSDAKAWGTPPMPPSPNLNDEDAERLVRWILELN